MTWLEALGARILERGRTRDHSTQEMAMQPGSQPTPSQKAMPRAAERAPKKPRIYARESTQNLYDGVDLLRQMEANRAHDGVIQRIRARLRDSSELLRIGFVVSSAARWNADSLLHGIRRDPRMTASLLLAEPEYRRIDQQAKADLYGEQSKFFRSIDPDLQELYDPESGAAVPIEDTGHDVLFLEMPWGMKDFPRRLVGRALTTYMHYGFMMMANHEMHYNIAPFHSYLWAYYTQTEGHRRMHLRHDPSAKGRLVVTGYPKLDVFADPAPTECEVWDGAGGLIPDRRRVIYAPHHSLGTDNLGMSTFDWSGPVAHRLMLQNPDIQWLYKPHPTLQYSVVRNQFMSADDYESYERAWALAPNATVYDSGRYFDAFRTSDALITCSGSFLAEYLPTGKPIIWLVSERTVGLNEVGARLAEGFYQVRTATEMEETFDRVVVKQQDPLLEIRAARTQELFPRGTRAGDAILDHLRQAFGLGPG